MSLWDFAIKTDAETAANVLNEYLTTFFLFCNGSPINALTSAIILWRLSLGVKNLFSAVYAPWSNDTVESVCKEVLRVMHEFNSETRTPEADWPNSLHSEHHQQLYVSLTGQTRADYRPHGHAF